MTLSKSTLDTIGKDASAALSNRLKPWRFIVIGLCLLGVLFLLEGSFFTDQTPLPRIAALIIGALLLYTAAIIWFILLYLTRRKVYDSHIIPSVFQALALSRFQGRPEVMLKPKPDKENIRALGLFSRSATITHRFALKTATPEGHLYTLHASRFQVSSGQYSHVAYEGPYLVLEPDIRRAGSVLYHVRSKGKPSVKGTRFEQATGQGTLSLYIPKDTTPTRAMMHVLKEVAALVQHHAVHALYLAINDANIHLAIQPTKLTFIPRNITVTRLEALLEDVLVIEHVVKGLHDIMAQVLDLEDQTS
ncbi:MAG: hypothetical protein EA374_00375 [Acholeplasmatales bacterium]|nr:MAG: hypothetical protein EA374_00375 [Acholeplasmatales bacterium]